MSTRQPTSWALRIFVPGYLVLIGLGLIVGAIYLFVYQPDEWFVGGMAAVGGATMLVTTGALLTVARDR
jgi:peptidoglycan/LPS O-acetylase OafA/YrhL